MLFILDFEDREVIGHVLIQFCSLRTQLNFAWAIKLPEYILLSFLFIMYVINVLNVLLTTLHFELTGASNHKYTMVTSGSTCERVTSKAECEEAARQLGLSDTTADDDGQDGVNYDPPFCYFESGSLKFNSLATNTGPCTTSDQCICSTIATVGRSKHEASVLLKFCNLVSLLRGHNILQRS